MDAYKIREVVQNELNRLAQELRSLCKNEGVPPIVPGSPPINASEELNIILLDSDEIFLKHAGIEYIPVPFPEPWEKLLDLILLRHGINIDKSKNEELVPFAVEIAKLVESVLKDYAQLKEKYSKYEPNDSVSSNNKKDSRFNPVRRIIQRAIIYLYKENGKYPSWDETFNILKKNHKLNGSLNLDPDRLIKKMYPTQSIEIEGPKFLSKVALNKRYTRLIKLLKS